MIFTAIENKTDYAPNEQTAKICFQILIAAIVQLYDTNTIK